MGAQATISSSTVKRDKNRDDFILALHLIVRDRPDRAQSGVTT
jgi:hypothetical protein